MAWAKIDDAWWSHPKVMGISLAASGLWARAISWSCHHRRDTVPTLFLSMVGAEESHAEELVSVGLWKPCNNGWAIHDWAQYQEQSLSEKRAAAGAKGGKRSGEARRESSTSDDAKQTGSNAKQTDEANGQAGALPGPSRPGPSKSNGETRATRIPEGWTPDPEPELVKAIGGPKAAQEQLDRFVDHWKAQPGAKGRKVDWQATWRNWLRRSSEFGRAGPNGAEPAKAASPVFGSDEWERRQQEQADMERRLLGDNA